MMRTLAQTGNGWMTFKDKSNKACNQTALPGRTVHLSNLCTEILEVTSKKETAVCNLGSINLARHTSRGADGEVTFDFEKLARTVRTAVRQLDRVIDLNFYPIVSTRASNVRWRPVGLGVMGLQDVFFQMRVAFDAPAARALSKQIAEEIYFHALSASAELATDKGAHPAFAETRAARGELQFDAWGVSPADPERWDALRARIRATGLRNSLLVAIAPTATIASIAGCCECIEPQVSNLFKRETLSGDFLQMNRYLVAELKELGLWNDATRARLKMAEGSVQGIAELPAGDPRGVPDGVGDPDALAHRHGRRPRGLHRSEPVAQSLHREPQHRPALEHVLLRLEEGPQDDVLPALAPCDAHCQGHRRERRADPVGSRRQPARVQRMDAATTRREGRCRRRLLAREPGDLRGLPVSAVNRPRACSIRACA